MGITGVLGCGATELALSLFGLRPATFGSIEMTGSVVRVNSVRDAMKLGIAYVPEDRLTEGLLLPVSIARNEDARRKVHAAAASLARVTRTADQYSASL